MSKNEKSKIRILNLQLVQDKTIPLKPTMKTLVTFQVDNQPIIVKPFKGDLSKDEKALIETIREFLKTQPKPPDVIGKEFEI